MDASWQRRGGKIRARIDAAEAPMRGIFRIEDESRRALRRIRDARHPQEAIALYWRAIGASLPGLTMARDLDRRIGRARDGMARSLMQTGELPLGPGPADDAAVRETAQTRRSRSKPASTQQADLFDEATAAALPEANDADAQAVADAEPVAAQLEAEPELEPEPAPRADPEPRLLDPETILLARADPRNLRPTDRADSYLYHVTNSADAELALRQGLLVSATDPMILTERQGVGYWLSVLAEDYDYILDGPADFVVLRLRRLTVEALLEPDPHASRSAGCPCYLLTGGAATRRG